MLAKLTINTIMILNKIQIKIKDKIRLYVWKYQNDLTYQDTSGLTRVPLDNNKNSDTIYVDAVVYEKDGYYIIKLLAVEYLLPSYVNVY